MTRPNGLFGRLLSIALPLFDSIGRLLLDMGTNEAFCAKLCQKFHASMRLNTRNMLTHIFGFMLIGIFIDPFLIAEDQKHMTLIMFVFKNINEDLCSFINQGCNNKVTTREI